MSVLAAIERNRRRNWRFDTKCLNTYYRYVASALRKELRQNRPFETAEQEAFLSVLRTAAVLTDELEQVLKPAGLSLAQYNVLRILRGAEPHGLCRNEVRDRTLTRMPDMTRLLDRMEKAGLVDRTRSQTDRRLVTTRITGRALRLLNLVEGAVVEKHRDRFGHLSKSEMRGLIGVLDRVRQAEI